MQRMPETRQTLLFSATMPSALAEFARAGLKNPTVVRLDVETKMSPNLKVLFIFCLLFWALLSVISLSLDLTPNAQIAFLTLRKEEKPAALLYLLRM